MATKHNCSCLEKAGDNEPIFVLRAQDRLAPWVVRIWANLAMALGVSVEKRDEAMRCAQNMEDWARDHYSKVPD